MVGISTLSLYFLAFRKEAENKEDVMNIEYIISGLIVLLLLAYLIYGLLKPEKF